MHNLCTFINYEIWVHNEKVLALTLFNITGFLNYRLMWAVSAGDLPSPISVLTKQKYLYVLKYGPIIFRMGLR